MIVKQWQSWQCMIMSKMHFPFLRISFENRVERQWERQDFCGQKSDQGCHPSVGGLSNKSSNSIVANPWLAWQAWLRVDTRKAEKLSRQEIATANFRGNWRPTLLSGLPLWLMMLRIVIKLWEELINSFVQSLLALNAKTGKKVNDILDTVQFVLIFLGSVPGTRLELSRYCAQPCSKIELLPPPLHCNFEQYVITVNPLPFGIDGTGLRCETDMRVVGSLCSRDQQRSWKSALLVEASSVSAPASVSRSMALVTWTSPSWPWSPLLTPQLMEPPVSGVRTCWMKRRSSCNSKHLTECVLNWPYCDISCFSRWAKETHDLVEDWWNSEWGGVMGISLVSSTRLNSSEDPPNWHDIVYGYRELSRKELNEFGRLSGSHR